MPQYVENGWVYGFAPSVLPEFAPPFNQQQQWNPTPLLTTTTNLTTSATTSQAYPTDFLDPTSSTFVPDSNYLSPFSFPHTTNQQPSTSGKDHSSATMPRPSTPAPSTSLLHNTTTTMPPTTQYAHFHATPPRVKLTVSKRAHRQKAAKSRRQTRQKIASGGAETNNEDDDSDAELTIDEQKTATRRTVSQKRPQKVTAATSAAASTDKAPNKRQCFQCKLCLQTGEKRRVRWIQCVACEAVAHPECVDSKFEWACCACRLCLNCLQAQGTRPYLICPRCTRGFHRDCIPHQDGLTRKRLIECNRCTRGPYKLADIETEDDFDDSEGGKGNTSGGKYKPWNDENMLTSSSLPAFVSCELDTEHSPKSDQDRELVALNLSCGKVIDSS